MERIEWKAEYSVGVPELDAQHKELIELINRLTEAGNRTAVIADVLAALDRYVKEHFRLEEQMMRTCGYEHEAEHEVQHRVFEEWLLSIKLTYGFSASTEAFSATVNAFLRNWLINHILKSDMAYKPVLARRRQQDLANNGA